MKAVDELIGRATRHSLPTGRNLAAFCDHLAQKALPAPGSALTVVEVAAAFRQFYRLPVPVVPQLEALLAALEIGLVQHSNPNDPDACAAFDADAQRWEIFVRYDLGFRKSQLLLQEIYSILHGISLERIPWWEEQATGGGRSPDVARAFALAVAMPPALFLRRAFRHGLNLWTLASEFMTTPGACFYVLARHLQLPFPYFQAQLNFRPECSGQRQFWFEGNGVRAQVWKKCLKRIYGPDRGEWPEVAAAAKAFPRSGQIMEAGGVLYQAIKTGLPQSVLTAEMAGVRLPRPVSLVARPNGTARSRMFVQIVPADYAAILLDEVMSERSGE